MIRTHGTSKTFHRLIRGIVLLNFILLVLDSSNAFPSFQDLLRRNQLGALLFYWVDTSTLLVIGFFSLNQSSVPT